MFGFESHTNTFLCGKWGNAIVTAINQTRSIHNIFFRLTIFTFIWRDFIVLFPGAHNNNNIVVNHSRSCIWLAGVWKPRIATDGSELPSAKQVSEDVHRPSYAEDYDFTVMLAVWGQFMDHDITATALSRGEGQVYSFPINFKRF